ncbi:type I phosphomannose isomerase catalytic subunit [Mesomycoplasma neurolyticum]|uniref:Phosphohexomutase n=1 Tax=Mesomycoplasma neurolyticum TaxID=2120 RepID=A0A449A5Y8_9BACT|nr:type I phosphomannose isomerase catalytic subunit [Mesomycoplasma neurolyticum]VEU59573.1 Putative mannose-6-phosphate isomerase yvyI [Mesomycoplasma neurolyticum]
MDKIIFLKPFLKSVLWGGDNLRKLYKTEQKNIGEAWLISAIENYESTIINKDYKNIKLNDFFKQNKEFFLNYKGEYPNLTKFIDTKDNLSIQVHPDDEMAREQHNSFGKDECWYVLDHPSEKSVIGLKKGRKSRIINDLRNNKIKKWLKFDFLMKDDFLYIPAGMVHGLAKNMFVYELQQSSDITYRIYDYDRVDLNGEGRQLHIKEAIKAIKTDINEEPIIVLTEDLIQNKYFNLNRFVISSPKAISLEDNKWAEVVVVEGNGFVNDMPIKKGSAFLVSGLLKEFKVKGSLTIMVNFVK